MKSNKSKLLAVVSALLIIAGIGAAAYAFTRPDDTKKAESSSKEEVVTGPANKDYVAPDPLLPTIVFNDDGFTQDTYTYPAGTAIRVDNQSSMDLQFSSDDHPAHRDTPELNMDVLGAGESGTFTPPGKGTYGFHDHINDQFEGTLIIQ